MRLDSHQHFWKYDPREYGWMQPDWPIRRDYLPDDLRPLAQGANIDGTIAVQARQTLTESHWLLELADGYPLVRGVVGWVDLQHERVAEQLEDLAQHPRFVGVRHVVQDEPDDRFLLRPDFQRGIAELRSLGLVYDLLIFPKQLPAAIELVKNFPEQVFVLDHLAKPLVREQRISPWREQIRELAQNENVFCKVSGLVTEAKWKQWTAADFRPYLDVGFEVFGPERLMFGSDWPVCLLSGSYREVYDLVDQYARAWSPVQRADLFGETARRVYLKEESKVEGRGSTA